MSIDISAVLEGGYERTVAPTGLQFAGLFFLVSVLSALFTPELQSVAPEGMPAGDFAPAAGPQPYTPSLGLSPGLAGVLSLPVAVVSLVVTLGALRTFVHGDTEEIPREHFRRNVGWAVVNLVVGGIVASLAVGIGLVLLVVPGLFLLVSLLFWGIFVAVEDESFVDGFQHSWDLTGGHRLQLFGLGVVVVVVAGVVSIAFGIPAALLPGLLGFLVETVGSALVTVFFLTSLAEAYNQLTATAGESTAEERYG